MKILVTGGAGFIGSHVVDAYVKLGHRVVVVDNLSTGFRKNLDPRARFYKADINDAEAVEKIFKKEKPEIVNHHAAVASVMQSLRNPLPTLETNVMGTARILAAFAKFCRGKNCKFIFASTGGALYGNPEKLPASESAPASPFSSYGFSKLLGEKLIEFYGKQFGFDYLIFRYPNVYGPRQNPKGEAGVVAIFGGMMKRGIRPVIFGDGSKARDYTYVGDIARANVAALGRGKNDILNLGWGKLITDRAIFETIKKELSFVESSREEKKKIPEAPKYSPYRKGEVYKIALDSGRARKAICWRPKMKLGDGIRKTLETL